jgi:hypothetical protein
MTLDIAWINNQWYMLFCQRRDSPQHVRRWNQLERPHDAH